jgi:nitrate reductase NapAB chaperone NapD
MSEKVKGPWKLVVVTPDESLQDALNEMERTHAVEGVIWNGFVYHVIGKEKKVWKPSRSTPAGGMGGMG